MQLEDFDCKVHEEEMKRLIEFAKEVNKDFDEEDVSLTKSERKLVDEF